MRKTGGVPLVKWGCIVTCFLPPCGGVILLEMDSLRSEEVLGGSVSNALYDRQLRLWGLDGQRALSRAHVVALGATSTLTEALKSIVLTGIRMVTLVDDRSVSNEDLATNFFLEHADVGHPLADSVMTHLCALNEDCEGRALRMSPSVWAARFVAEVETNPSASGAPLVGDLGGHVVANEAAGKGGLAVLSLLLVGTDCGDLSPVTPFVQAARRCNVPVVCAVTMGLVGYVQPWSRDRVCIHTCHDALTAVRDLRIFNPFPALKTWFDAHDPDDCQRFRVGDPDALSAHSYLPSIAILNHAYRIWVMSKRRQEPSVERTAAEPPPANTGDNPPDSILPPLSPAAYAEIRSIISGMIRRISPPQESFMEALEQCRPILNRPYCGLPPPLQALFADTRCTDPARHALQEYRHPDDPRLRRDGNCCTRRSLLEMLLREDVIVWFALRAVHHFYEQEGVLPFCGFVPDFTTTTVWFRQLSQIYETKHHEDVCRITELTLSLVQTYVLPLLPQTQHDVAETLRAWVHGLARDLVKNIWSVCLVQLLPLPGTEDPVAWRRHQAQRARRALRSLSDPTDRCSARSAYLSVGLVALHQLPPRERCGHDDCSLPVARDLFSAVEALLSDSVPEEDEEPEASGAWWEPHRHGLHQCCHEILRFGSTELASVAATVGALAAQECIKLIQRQRVPAHQLILYNGLDNQFFLME